MKEFCMEWKTGSIVRRKDRKNHSISAAKEIVLAAGARAHWDIVPGKGSSTRQNSTPTRGRLNSDRVDLTPTRVDLTSTKRDFTPTTKNVVEIAKNGPSSLCLKMWKQHLPSISKLIYSASRKSKHMRNTPFEWTLEFQLIKPNSN